MTTQTLPGGEFGLPAIRPPLCHIMCRAHDLACEMHDRIPYAARFRQALRRAWQETRAAAMRQMRKTEEDRVERLLAFLDTIDGDPDLEPSLGYYVASHAVDAEHDPSNDEFTLGSLDRMTNQENWSSGDNGDRELDRSDDEDGGDHEPSWGWSNPFGAKVDAKGFLVVESAPDRQVRP